MLQSAIEAEVDTFLHEQHDRRNAGGQRLVVRNGYLPTREIITGAGALEELAWPSMAQGIGGTPFRSCDASRWNCWASTSSPRTFASRVQPMSNHRRAVSSSPR